VPCYAIHISLVCLYHRSWHFVFPLAPIFLL
jgi:hypothetical protein